MNRIAGTQILTAAIVFFYSAVSFASPYKGNTNKVTVQINTPSLQEQVKQGAETLWQKLSDKKKSGKTQGEKASDEKKGVVQLDVGLLKGQYSVTVLSSRGLVISDLASGKILNKFSGKDTVSFTYKNRQLCINRKPISAQRIILRADGVNITVNGDEYRGEIVLVCGSGGITVVNRVDLESYVKGVVGTEMSADWPREALKAQAVAARTFSLYTKNEGKHQGDGYNICAGTHCQVYGGTKDESSSVTRAVDDTRGEIITYKGKPIYAAFHTDSGGRTAASREVWGGELEYLISVEDPSGAPNRHWQVTMTAEQMAEKLKAAGKDVGTLKKISLSPLNLRKPGAGDRYKSGRPARIVFTGNKRSVTINGTQARSIFGVKSALFDFEPGRKGNDLKIKSGQKIKIDGFGFGHGIGLSQWGAKAMSAKKDYKSILHHYYSGVAITKIY